MKIALCTDAIIPPEKYGGIERHVAWLARGLKHLGHEVVLVAKKGSNLPGVELIETTHNPDWDRLAPIDCDILHLSAPASVPPKRPFVLTIHGNGKPGEIFHPNSIFLTKTHADKHRSKVYVYNGIDPADYKYEEKRQNRLVFLAKASWSVKNLPGAIAVARRAGMRLDVIGSRNLPFNLHRWIRIWSRLRGIKYYGSVSDEEKTDILKNARALVFPVRWEEPFGAVIIEALVSGCCVLGTPYGSIPELVTPEVGLLATDAAVLARAARDAEKFFSPKKCREFVLSRFTHIEMAKNYLEQYEAIVKTGRLKGVGPNDPPASSIREESSTMLLPWTN